MQTFSYATKDGKLKNFEASNENEALSRLSGFGDSAENSGVMKARTLPQPTLGSTNDTPKTTYSAFTPITNAQAEQDRILAQQQARAERNASQEINEDDIYRDQLAMFQKEIDATNQIYAQMMADQKMEGRGNLGSAGAIQARSGLLGSDFASGQNAEVTKQNREVESLISAQQSAAIAQIQGLARRSAVEEIARKRQAQQQGLQDYITYLGQSNERRASKVNALRDQLLQQGVKLEDIDPSTLNKILKDFGITKDEVALAYADEEVRRAQEAEVKRIEAEDKAFDRRIKSRFNLSPGETMYELDENGNAVSVGGGYSGGSGGTGGGAASNVGEDGLYKGEKWQDRIKFMSPVAQSVVQGHLTIDQLTPTERGQVAGEFAKAGIPSSRQSALQQNLRVADDLLSSKGLKNIAGSVDQYIGGRNPFDTDTAYSLNLYKQLSGLIDLEGRNKLKGSGTITDAEFAKLAEAEKSLGRNLDDVTFKKVIEDIRDVFAGKYALTGASDNLINVYDNEQEAPQEDAASADAEYEAYLNGL